MGTTINQYTRHCKICDKDPVINEFVTCLICKCLTHICNPLMKNAKVDMNFVNTADLSGFKYICRICTPQVNSLSVAICNIGVNLNTINEGMSHILNEVQKIKKKQDSLESQTLHNVQTNQKASFSEVFKQSTIVIASKNPNDEKEELKDKVRKSINPESNLITSMHATTSNKIVSKH
ncbi:hypothetical protein ACKWTF_007619 [Chironomus riparius]